MCYKPEEVFSTSTTTFVVGNYGINTIEGTIETLQIGGQIDTKNVVFGICDDQEKATAMAKYVEENIWSFTPHFLASHCVLPVEVIQLIQDNMCERASTVFLALIPPESSEFRDLCSEALSVDGFGHFFNTYDGSSEDVEFDGETYTVFRID